MSPGPVVNEGGAVLQTIDLDRGCFACTLGGADRRTLFLMVAQWRGMEQIPEVSRARTGQVLPSRPPHLALGAVGHDRNPLGRGVRVRPARQTPEASMCRFDPAEGKA